MSELSITLADMPAVAETLAESAVGDEITAQVSLRLNSIDADVATFDIDDFTIDSVVESELNADVAEEIAPPSPAPVDEATAANLVFGEDM